MCLDVDSVLPSSPSQRRAARKELTESKYSTPLTTIIVAIIVAITMYWGVCMLCLLCLCAVCAAESSVRDLKFDLKLAIDKIRTNSLTKNKDSTVSY